MSVKKIFVVLLLAWPLNASAQGWKTEWDKTLAAAKKEGKVVVAGFAGQPYREALTTFQKSYPDLRLDFVGIQGQHFAPRVMQERRASQFLWDVHVGGASTMLNVLLPERVLDPLRAALILPEVLEDKNWKDGFESGWMDREVRYIYGFSAFLTYTVFINRDVIPETEFTKVEALWDPKRKGKIIWQDPRKEGIGTSAGALILLNFGEDALRRLFMDQGVVITEDYRQLVEWLARGRYPIGVAVNVPHLRTFQKEGVGKNVLPLKEPKLAFQTAGGGHLSLINQAAHPNASKVYVNWLLSKEGQTAYAKNTADNSRRLDVPAGDVERLPQVGIRYLDLQRLEYQDARKKVHQMAKEIFQ